ncbi:MAG TPA: class I SAM-dependent methyltransferase [Micromonosporaceae bacterium]|jgi:SAM-dependent methyltransferase
MTESSPRGGAAHKAMVTAERVRWAVEMLTVDPDDHLLEIGCGRGAAISMICRCLGGGKITAIDRSATMVRLAEQRNREHISSGKAAVRAVALEEADFGPERFDKIFAINLNLFWVRSPAKELDLLRTLLKPNGSLYLFYEPPDPSRLPKLADRLVAVLAGNGFTTTTTTSSQPRPLLAVVARVK